MASALPPYAFVPGHWPHPTNDPRGHSYGHATPPTEPPLRLEAWPACSTYLDGVRLFNAGYYWEAHESWEALWLAANRRGVVAEFLKGLIKLAAAGVKIRQRNVRGARKLLTKSVAHHARVCAEVGSNRVAGLDLSALAARVEALGPRLDRMDADPNLPVEVVLEPLDLSEGSP